MELWDDDYINTERQAFIEIGPDNLGSFQFGLVRGQLDGFLERAECEPADHPRAPMQTSSDRFAFTWDGFDEMDEVSGSGWMRLTSANEAVGLIKIHLGDRSTSELGESEAAEARDQRAGMQHRHADWPIVSYHETYEFLAIERRLTPNEMRATRCYNYYDWGGLKADPHDLVSRYFDFFVYSELNSGARWGTLRFPAD